MPEAFGAYGRHVPIAGAFYSNTLRPWHTTNSLSDGGNPPGEKRPNVQENAPFASTVAVIAWLVSMSHILRP